MGSFVDTPFSLSSLLCHEQDESIFIFQQDENDNNPCFLLDDEEEYIHYLFKQETGFGSLSYDDDVDSSKSLFWFRNARLNAIDWIFNTQAKFGFTYQTAYLSITYFDRFLSKRSIDESKPWAIQLLSVACLSIAAKMEEQRVPPLSEYPIEYRFENKVIKNMELLILSTLEWKMGLPTPFAYLHYFFTKFCNESRLETIISKATQHIVTLVKEFNLMNQRPSIIASASILAAYDSTLTKKEMDLRLSVISSWGNLESGQVFSCYNVIQEKRINKVKKTPSSDLLLSTETNSTCDVVENKSNGCLGVKRKLGYENIEECQEQKLQRL
ncbi:unnamed protein product [Trifolium pratense]|uniref:Uncharacterized protein n=1 Tax=Trifolium pratense TaxID=57577 RepID=A0ACB0JLS7_TRIPR|nr:unnamed protein product [Trifolium pratense]